MSVCKISFLVLELVLIGWVESVDRSAAAFEFVVDFKVIVELFIRRDVRVVYL